MVREREGHTLQATALVNEAYLRLIDAPSATFQDRAHFFGMCATLMRLHLEWKCYIGKSGTNVRL